MIKQHILDLVIEHTCRPGQFLLNPAAQYCQPNGHDSGKETQTPGVLPLRLMTPTAGPIKRKTEDRQCRGEVNTDGMESQERTGFEWRDWHIVLRPSNARAVQDQRHEQKGQSPRADF